MRQLFRALPLLLLMATACSGGGTSAPAASPQPSFAGAGTDAAVNQKITFSIVVPAASTSSAAIVRTAAALRHTLAAPSPQPTTPYISPATAAIVLTLAEVNGISLQKAPSPIPAIPITCQACTFKAPNIPAAIGLNRYLVQTYSGYAGGQATGNLISTGFVDVAVPVTNSPTLGGAAALSVGGFVARISLAPGTVNFPIGIVGTQNLLVQALDAGGATIIGSVQYVSPIVVSVLDAQNFTLDGAASETLTGTLARPIALRYNGNPASLGTTVTATSQDENGNAVDSAPVLVFVNAGGPGPSPSSSPTPTPVPTPTLKPGQSPPPPTPTPSSSPLPSPSPTIKPTPLPSPTAAPTGTSLYIADGGTDTVSEYSFITSLEGGHIPNPIPTPKRVMQFDLSLAQQKIPTLGCSYSPLDPPPTNVINSSYGTSGMVVAGDGTIFTFPTCVDGPGNAYVFGFPATSVGPVGPTILDPILNGGNPESLAYAPSNAKQGTVYGSIQTLANPIVGFPSTSSGAPPTVDIGQTCYQEFQQPDCSISPPTGGFQPQYTNMLGVGPNGFTYFPANWNDTATGDASDLLQPAALMVLPPSASSNITVPYSAIAGSNSLIGGSGSGGAPLATFVDGTTLYVLTGVQILSLADGSHQYWPGVSSCPAPSSNAPVNTNADGYLNNNCTDGYQHMYVAAYTINASLLGPGAFGTDVDLQPLFVIGGDVVGGFGCSINGGQFLAESAGYVYVINQQPNCNNNVAPEIDIYNTNGLLGVHTDVAPIARINLNSGWPIALGLGPTGTVTGGQSVLRTPRARAFRNPYFRRYPVRPRPRSLFRRPPYR